MNQVQKEYSRSHSCSFKFLWILVSLLIIFSTTHGQSKNLLSEIIDEYAAESRDNWHGKTESEIISVLKLMLEILGDVPIQSIDKKKMMTEDTKMKSG